MDLDNDIEVARERNARGVWEPSGRWASAAGSVVVGLAELREWSFEVGAEPVGQPRPRFRIMRMGRRLIGKAYSPTGKHSELKSAVRNAACRAVGKVSTIDSAVAVTIECWMPKAVSDRSARWWHSKKPDIDNIAKCVLDGLNDSGIWSDDSRVAILNISKIDAPDGDESPRLFVAIKELPERERPVRKRRTTRKDLNGQDQDEAG
jgi:Holliday junction resolvase RusA-like endonuclease